MLRCRILIRPEINRINCKDPESIKFFNQRYSEYLIIEKVPQLLGKLQKGIIPGKPLTEAQQKQYENIDKIKVYTAKRAQRKCRKVYMGGVPYSKSIIPYWRKIEAWNLAVNRHKYKNTPRKIKQKFLVRTLQNARIDKNDERLKGLEQCKMN